jgi:hypothetical protein
MLLLFFIRLGMARTRDELTPLMSFEEAIDGGFMDFMPSACFKFLLDVGSCSDFSLGCPFKKGLQEVAFFFQAEILAAPSSFARRFHCCHPKPIIGRYHIMDC